MTPGKGSCQCGQLAYEIDGDISDCMYCHCGICRKLTGSALAAYGSVKRDCFSWAPGSTPPQTYSPTQDTTRYFCRDCGGFLVSEHKDDPGLVFISLGTLDSHADITISYHQFTSATPAWCQLDDGLPHHSGWPERPSATKTSTAFTLFAVRIFTYDWERALAFYRDTAGFEVTFANPGFGWAQLRAGGAFIGLERCSLDDPESEDLVGRFVGASLEVDDIHATYQALANNGVEFVSPPKAQDWGGILAHFKDPDGNVLTLLNKVTP